MGSDHSHMLVDRPATETQARELSALQKEVFALRQQQAADSIHFNKRLQEFLATMEKERLARSSIDDAQRQAFYTYVDERLAAVERRMQDGMGSEKADRQADWRFCREQANQDRSALEAQGSNLAALKLAVDSMEGSLRESLKREAADRKMLEGHIISFIANNSKSQDSATCRYFSMEESTISSSSEESTIPWQQQSKDLEELAREHAAESEKREQLAANSELRMRCPAFDWPLSRSEKKDYLIIGELGMRERLVREMSRGR